MTYGSAYRTPRAIPPFALSCAAIGSPSSVAPSLAAALARADPNLTFTFRPLADQVALTWTQESLVARLSGFFSGLALGGAFSVWVTKFVGSLLYSVTPRDPFTLLGSALVLAAVGLLAGWLPAVAPPGGIRR